MRDAAVLDKKRSIAGVGLIAAAGATATGAFAVSNPETNTESLPPKGTRAQVQVSPNPAWRGQEVTITGNCGGGTNLKRILSGFGPDKPVLEDIRIVADDPEGFVAKARLTETVGNGVGPVFVDCGGEVGVTLLVTHA
ncbi:hypothetical protein AB0I53_40160 [Saccharopolyspora sp. NPDC050389]|uniref:hypothetical protein n=1 Tax=Saccharopolyspora sp. NPDC050389 TaxID=3155516 RepID=UPI0034089840